MKYSILLVISLSLTACGGASGGSTAGSNSGRQYTETNEYNGDDTAAQKISSSAKVNGTLTSGVDYSDYYQFELTSEKKVTVTLDSNEDFRFYIYGDQTYVFNTSELVNGKQTVSSNLEADTYFINVQSYGNTGEYTLNIR